MRRNIKTLGIQQNCEIWKMDYKKALAAASEQGRKFDLVYLDPPYQKQQIDWILTYLEEHDLLQELMLFAKVLKRIPLKSVMEH